MVGSRVRNGIAAAVFAFASAACAASRAGTAAGQLAPDNGAAGLKVTNENFYDMAVYVVNAGVPVRIGTVMGNQTRTFRVDPSFISTSQLRVVAKPIGSNGLASTGTLIVKPGDMVDFRITTMLSQSTAIIR